MNKTELLNRLNKILTQLTQKDVSSAKADLTVLIVDIKHIKQERTVTSINHKIHHVDGGW
jgi:translation initiation factor IF-2